MIRCFIHGARLSHPDTRGAAASFSQNQPEADMNQIDPAALRLTQFSHGGG
jgi:hypothetical protein